MPDNNVIMGHVNELYKRFSSIAPIGNQLDANSQKILEIIQMHAKTEEWCKNLEVHLKALVSAQGSFEDFKKNITMQVDSLKDSMPQIGDKCKEIESNQDQLYHEQLYREKVQSEALNTAIRNLGHAIQKQFDGLKNEFIVSPASILETNQTVIQKIEECRMDCANSMLKQKNFDTQIMFFQKRLEQLEQRIKKMELEKEQ